MKSHGCGASGVAVAFIRSNPARVHLFVEACAIAASLIEKSLPNIFPDGMRSIIFDGIGFLNFDDAEAAHALDSKHMARDFREAALLEWQWRPASGARIGQERVPYFIRQGIAGARVRLLSVWLTRSAPA